MSLTHLAQRPGKRRPPVSPEQLELCIAYLKGKVTTTGLTRALGSSRTNAKAWVMTRLVRAIAHEQLTVTVAP